MPDADDELAGGAVVLHVAVGLWHLLQAVVDAVHGKGQPAGHDRVEDLLEGLPRQVGGVAEVARQAHALLGATRSIGIIGAGQWTLTVV
jgi:hypothetical protein